jgi:protein-tyrosine phosphatase
MSCHEKLEKGEQIERLLVHCKAGIGRTGTTIGLINMVTQMKLQQKANEQVMISPFSTIR